MRVCPLRHWMSCFANALIYFCVFSLPQAFVKDETDFDVAVAAGLMSLDVNISAYY